MTSKFKPIAGIRLRNNQGLLSSLHHLLKKPRYEEEEEDEDENIKNYYTDLDEKFMKQHSNPKYSEHLLKVPFRMLIIGGSGSGKTNVVRSIIDKTEGTFSNIIIVTKMKDEPLYNSLEESMKDQSISFTITEGIKSVPLLDSLAEIKGQILIIFDDLVLEKNQSEIEQYFIRGRKIAGGISVCYLSQDYYLITKLIRSNANYILLKKLASVKDLKLILSEYNIGELSEVVKLYEKATEKFENFLLIDISAPDSSKFRKGFKNILTIPEEEE